MTERLIIFGPPPNDTIRAQIECLQQRFGIEIVHTLEPDEKPNVIGMHIAEIRDSNIRFAVTACSSDPVPLAYLDKDETPKMSRHAFGWKPSPRHNQRVRKARKRERKARKRNRA